MDFVKKIIILRMETVSLVLNLAKLACQLLIAHHVLMTIIL